MEILRVITFGAILIAAFLCIIYWVSKLVAGRKQEPEIIHIPAPAEPYPPIVRRHIGFAPVSPKEILNDAMKELERIDADEIHLSIAHGNGEKIITLDLNIKNIKQ